GGRENVSMLAALSGFTSSRAAGMSPRDVIKQTYKQLREDDVLTYAASLAYHSFLALFPFLVFLVALVTSFDQVRLLENILDWTARVVPEQSMAQITAVLRRSMENGDAGLLSLGAAGAIWAASGGVRSAMTVLNRAFDVEDGRALWKKYLLSIAYTLGLSVLVVLAAGVVVAGPAVAGWVLDQVGWERTPLRWWTWVRYPILVLLLMLTAGLAYSLLPSIDRFRLISPGAVLAVTLWVAVSLGFRLYISNFGRYDVLYGSIGAVIVLLLYLWICSIVLLVGGELDSVLERAGAARFNSRES
ncbi:MAG TPA: YihY/virulence factor BrkB family protein, partial [Gemmatimonadaceae bacterium]